MRYYLLAICFTVMFLPGCSSTTTSVGELNYAIMNDDLRAVRSGIENGANVNGRNGERQSTPLHTAAGRGNVAVVKALVEAGAEVDVADCSGMTPLMYSAWKGSVAVSRYLVDQGANVNRQIRESNVTCGKHSPDGSALSVASASNEVEVVRFLLNRGATAGGKRALAIALADPAREPVLKALKSAGYTADEETARIIASLPPEARSVNNSGNNPTQTAQQDTDNSDDIAAAAADVAITSALFSIIGF